MRRTIDWRDGRREDLGGTIVDLAGIEEAITGSIEDLGGGIDGFNNWLVLEAIVKRDEAIDCLGGANDTRVEANGNADERMGAFGAFCWEEFCVTIDDLDGASKDRGGAIKEDFLGAREVLVGAREVLVGAREVLVGTIELLVGAREVLVGAKEFLVGAREVLVGAREVLVGAREVLVGARDVLVGARDVLVGARDVLVGARDVLVTTVDRGVEIDLRVVGIIDLRRDTTASSLGRLVIVNVKIFFYKR